MKINGENNELRRGYRVVVVSVGVSTDEGSFTDKNEYEEGFKLSLL